MQAIRDQIKCDCKRLNSSNSKCIVNRAKNKQNSASESFSQTMRASRKTERDTYGIRTFIVRAAHSTSHPTYDSAKEPAAYTWVYTAALNLGHIGLTGC